MKPYSEHCASVSIVSFDALSFALPLAANPTAKCLKFSTFPWLPLTTADRHVLSSNERYVPDVFQVFWLLVLIFITMKSESYYCTFSSGKKILSGCDR